MRVRRTSKGGREEKATAITQVGTRRETKKGPHARRSGGNTRATPLEAQVSVPCSKKGDQDENRKAQKDSVYALKGT